MLVLTRGVNQSISIGDNIQVMVTDVRFENGRPYVRLGITAPEDISIWRSEKQFIPKPRLTQSATDDSPPLGKFLKDN